MWAKLSIGLGAVLMIAAIGGYPVFQASVHELNIAVTTAHLLNVDPKTKPQLVGKQQP